MGRQLKKAVAQNAAVAPVAPQITAPVTKPLSEVERIAIETIAFRLQQLEQQQREFMKVQADTLKQWKNILSETEKAHQLPAGSIGKEWAVIEGQLVFQGIAGAGEQKVS